MAHVRDAAHNIRDLSAFREELAADDPWSTVPAADLLTGLRGKDVVIAFVESYGGWRWRDRGSRRTSGSCSTPARRAWGRPGSPPAART